MRKIKRMFNIRYIALSFAFFILGIAFFTDLTAGISASVVFLVSAVIVGIKRRKPTVFILLLIFFIGGGAYAYSARAVYNGTEYPEGYGAIAARVSLMSDRDSSGDVDGRIIVEDIVYNGEKIKGKALLKFENFDDAQEIELKIGDMISFEAEMKKMPLEIDGIGSSANYVDKIYWSLSVKRFYGVKGNETDLREKIVLSSTKFVMNNTKRDTGAFIIGAIFGDKSAMSEEMKTISSRLGIAHLFAVSGLHVGVIAAAVSFLLKKLGVSGRYRLAVVPFLIFYAYVTGFTVSVVRAVIMTGVALIANAVNRRYDVITSFSIAGIMTLAVEPAYLFDTSFLLSYLAVFSLILFGKSVMRVMKRLPRGAASVLAGTLSVNIGLLPIMLISFGSVSLLTVPMNLIAIPFVSLYFPIFFALFIISAAFGLGGVLGVASYPFALINGLSSAVFKLDIPNITFEFGYVFLIAYIVIMIFSSNYVFTKKAFKKATASGLLIIIVLSLLTPCVSHSLGRGNIFVEKSGFVVYSALVDGVDGKKICVITGDVDEFSAYRTANMISRRGIGKIDVIVAPTYSDKNAVELGYLVRISGAKEVIIPRGVFVFEGIKVAYGGENISVSGTGDVTVENGEGRYLFANPENVFSKAEKYTLVVAMNDRYSTGGTFAEYYLNLAEELSVSDTTHFTFRIKNGRITDKDG